MDQTLKHIPFLQEWAPPMIVAASRMLIYLQSLQRCSVQNREIKFYKGFLEKKEISNLSIKKENII